jgi:hypothetical protein
MFFVPPERQPNLIARLEALECVPLSINSQGSHVLHESAEMPRHVAALA